MGIKVGEKISEFKKIERNLEIVKKYNLYISNGVAFKYFPVAIVKAKGAKVWDADGNEYIDFVSSAASYNVGHGNERVVEAMKGQLERYLHYCLYFYQEPAVELAELLTKITPGNFKKKVVLGLSGSDASDSAIKASLIYTKRPNIASFAHSYHGTTYMALSASGSIIPEVRSAMHARDVYFFQYPDTFRCPKGIEPHECGEYCLGLIEDFFKTTVAGSSFAAFLVEPIQGDGGILVPPEDFMKGLRKLTEEYGVVFIDDEVQTGLARTGKLFAIEHFGVEPDLMVLGKAIGGGMPVSAVVGRGEILDAAAPQTYFLTSGGHSLSAAAAIATIKFALEENLAEGAAALGKHAMKRFNELKEKHEIIGDVRGMGLLLGIDIVKDKEANQPDRNAVLKIIWRAWEKGLLMMSFGKYGNVLRIAPPLVITEEELNGAIDIIDESVADVVKGRVSDEVIKYLKAW